MAPPDVRVALVGAGPGDPDLLTVKAARLLGEADVVVHDALVGDGVLALARPGADLIDVGKRPGQGVAQELINVLLVQLAADGKRVVRLKGGDPFVFGRGGEEAVALGKAGVACEVVPGITSSIAAPAAAGVPVTYRGMSASFTVVTGHRQRGETPVNWHALAQAGGTLVVIGVLELNCLGLLPWKTTANKGLNKIYDGPGVRNPLIATGVVWVIFLVLTEVLFKA